MALLNMRRVYWILVGLIAGVALVIGLWSYTANASLAWGITRYGRVCWTRLQADERGYNLKTMFANETSCQTYLEQRGSD